VSQPTSPYVSAGPAPAVPPSGDEQLHPQQRAVLVVVRGVTYLIYGLVVAVEVILGVGFILLLLGANPSSSFVEWWYRNLDRVMEPFRGIFTPIELGLTSGNVPSIFETSVLFAMIIYAIAAMVIYGFASWLSKRLYRLDLEDRAYRDRMAIERQLYLDRVNAERIAAANQEAIARGVAAATQPAQPTPPPPPPA
jgi:hypothetical protein